MGLQRLLVVPRRVGYFVVLDPGHRGDGKLEGLVARAVLLVFSSGVVSSLGTLKPPGLSLFVAVLSRRPARKKEAISATPATIMSRLSTQETMFLALDLWTSYFFMPPEILTSKSLPARPFNALRADLP